MKSLGELLTTNPEVMGGQAVFKGTRVPLTALLDYLAGGDPLEDFLTDFPGVTRDVATAVIAALGAEADRALHAAAS